MLRALKKLLSRCRDSIKIAVVAMRYQLNQVVPPMCLVTIRRTFDMLDMKIYLHDYWFGFLENVRESNYRDCKGRQVCGKKMGLKHEI